MSEAVVGSHVADAGYGASGSFALLLMNWLIKPIFDAIRCREQQESACAAFAFHGYYSTWTLSCEYAADITSCVAGEHFVPQLPEHTSGEGTDAWVQI